MTLGHLIERVGSLVPLQTAVEPSAAAIARRVSAIEYDSRRVGPNAVFVAVRGQRHDAAAFALNAINRGAVAVIAETPPAQDVESAWYLTGDARRALAAAAVVLQNRPSEEIRTIGVTGTNGKTTTCYLLAHILDVAGIECGRIGTVSYKVGSEEREAPRTTPEAPDLQRILREMADGGSAACVMEVSSHALALHRVEFTRFAAAIFTNLTRDHLDFHDGMEDYFLAKRRLFEMLPENAPAIVNIDDPYGARLAADFPHVITYALDRHADVVPESLSLTLDGLTCDLRTPRGPLQLQSPLLGRPNAYNLLAAVAAALALDVPAAAIREGSATIEQVPGRLQRVSAPNDDINVIVDYAHTDDALRNLLETARPLARGRLVTVFGCGGDRDRTKRPLMGAVAARLSDIVIVTSDNPRSEDPASIIEEIKRGLVPPDRPLVRNGHPVAPVKTTPWSAIVDRRTAIAAAIGEAQAGDLVVIAGKGHEKYQEVAGRTFPFDDVLVAREALDARRSATGSGKRASR